jgi:hypothetical protein
MWDPAAQRHLLWGYIKELRAVDRPPAMCKIYNYANCASLPRCLYIKGDRLFQVGASGS